MFLNNFLFNKKIYEFFDIFKKKDLSRIKKNFFSKSTMFFSSALLQIIIVPLMIFSWGVEKYAIWIFFISLPALLTLLNLNVIAAARQELILSFNKKNINYANKIFFNSFFLTFINIFIFLLFYLIFNLFFFENIKIFENYQINNFLVLIISIAIGYSINLINSNFEIAISSKGRIYVGVYIKNFSDFFMFILVGLSGLVFQNINVTGIIYLSFQILQSVFFFIYSKKISNELIFKKKYINYKFIKYIIKLSRSYYLNTITYILRNSGLIYITALFFSPLTLVIISTVKTLFYFLPIKGVSLVADLSQYEYAKKYSNKKFKDIFKIFNIHITLVSLCLLFFLIFSFTIGKNIYDIWLVKEIDYNSLIIKIVTLDAIFIILYGVFISISKSINQFLRISIIEFIIIIIATITSCILGKLNFDYLYIVTVYSVASFLLLFFSLIIYFKFKIKIINKI